MAVGNSTTTNTYRLTDANTYNMNDSNTYLLVDVATPELWKRNSNGPNIGGKHMPEIKRTAKTPRIKKSG